MTIPLERSYAIRNTREFLRKLLDRAVTPRVPLAIRRLARHCLKHYPNELYMDQTRKALPEVWGKFPKEKK